MTDYYPSKSFCMYFRTSIDRMREAVNACDWLKWPDMVDIEIGDPDVDFPAQINFEPHKAGLGLTLQQFLHLTACVMDSAKHPGQYEFGIASNSDNPRFFYDTQLNNPQQKHGGFYLDETKIQGEAVMKLNKIREIAG
jgi:hypothetical protein